jgi:hypothetical protein
MTAPAHLCLVSNQPVPSLTPLIDPGLAVRQVGLVAAPDRQRHAGWLKDALARHGIAADLLILRDGYHLPSLREDFARLAERHPRGVIANITGGTKLMTIAAWETFNRPEDVLYYVDIGRDSIDWLRGGEARSRPIADRIKLDIYFAAHGLRYRKGAGPKRAPVGKPAMATARRNLGRLLATAGPWPGGVEEGGIWLEDLVFEALREATRGDPKVQDIARQFVVTTDEAGHALENEIDVVCLRDNTLHLIECKTGANVGKGAGAMKALFKLAQLRDTLGGLRGHGIFVTSEQVSASVRQRGGQLGITVIDRGQMRDLGHHLRAALHMDVAPPASAQPTRHHHP